VPMRLQADIIHQSALSEFRLALAEGSQAAGEVVVRLGMSNGQHATVRLGSRFVLDGELAEKIAEIDGVENVRLEPVRGRTKLKLVA